MKINRTGSAKWAGGIKDGKGSITTESGSLKEYPYGFASRFEGKPGSNPEELLAQFQRMTHYGITGFGTVAAFSKALKLQDDNKQLRAAVNRRD